MEKEPPTEGISTLQSSMQLKNKEKVKIKNDANTTQINKTFRVKESKETTKRSNKPKNFSFSLASQRSFLWQKRNNPHNQQIKERKEREKNIKLQRQLKTEFLVFQKERQKTKEEQQQFQEQHANYLKNLKEMEEKLKDCMKSLESKDNVRQKQYDDKICEYQELRKNLLLKSQQIDQRMIEMEAKEQEFNLRLQLLNQLETIKTKKEDTDTDKTSNLIQSAKNENVRLPKSKAKAKTKTRTKIKNNAKTQIHTQPKFSESSLLDGPLKVNKERNLIQENISSNQTESQPGSLSRIVPVERRQNLNFSEPFPLKATLKTKSHLIVPIPAPMLDSFHKKLKRVGYLGGGTIEKIGNVYCFRWKSKKPIPRKQRSILLKPSTIRESFILLTNESCLNWSNKLLKIAQNYR